MSDFSTGAEVALTLKDGETRRIKKQIESDIGAVEMGVSSGAAPSAQATTDGGQLTGRRRRRERRMFRMAKTRTDDLESAVSLLDDIEEKVGGGGGGGGGPLGGLIGNIGTGLGVGLGSTGVGIGAGAAGLGIGAGIGLATGDLPRGIGEGIGATLEGTGDFAEGVGEGIGGTLEGTGDFAEGVGEGIGGTLEGTGDFADGVGSGIGDALSGLGEGGGDILSGINPFKDQNTNISTLESQSTTIKKADFGDVSSLNLSVDQSNIANAGSGGGSLIDVSAGVSNDAEASGSVAVNFDELVRQADEERGPPENTKRKPLPVEDPSPLSVATGEPLEVETVAPLEVDAPDSIPLLRPTETDNETDTRPEPDIEEAMEKERPPEGAFRDNDPIVRRVDLPEKNLFGRLVDNFRDGGGVGDDDLTGPGIGPVFRTLTGFPPKIGGGGDGGGGIGRAGSGGSGGSFFGEAQLSRTTINNEITAESDFDVSVDVAADSIRSDLDELQREINRRIDDVEQSLRDEIERVEREIRR